MGCYVGLSGLNREFKYLIYITANKDMKFGSGGHISSLS